MSAIPIRVAKEARSAEPAPVVDAGIKPVLGVKEMLVCTDFSPASEAAMQEASRIWSRTSARVSILHVCEFGPMPALTEEGMDYVERLYAEKWRALEAAATRLREKGIEANTILLDGDAPSVILEQIEWLHPDLVVLGTRGTKGFERLFFGSTAEAIFRRARCPVVTVNALGGSSPRVLDTSPIVFATEFHSDESRCVRFAVAMANAFEAPLHCVHVLPASLQEGERLTAKSTMIDALQTLTGHGSQCVRPPVYSVLSGSDVASSIVEYAERVEAHAIVLGVRSKSRIAAHIPRQRADRIIMTASCAVITITCALGQ